MKKKLIALLVILFFTRYLPVSGQAEKDAYEILVYNSSKFDIKCVPQCEKNEGDFAASTSYLNAGKLYLFRVQRSAGGILPRGVEGTISFSTLDPGYPAAVQVHFNNPAVGSSEFKIESSNWPINIVPLTAVEVGKIYNGFFKEPVSYIKIIVDTSRGHTGKTNPPSFTGSGSTKGGTQPAESLLEPIPPVINFDWKVNQRMRKDEDDDDNKGKAYKEVTYLFTSSGDYAAVKPDNADFSLMIYSKKGYTWIIDDNKKTITVMSMPKTVGEGAAMGKGIAEDIKKAPLEKDRDEDNFTIIKTGKTKQYLGYTAEEFELRTNSNKTTKNASKTGSASFWYAKVPFDPVKVYTMGVGRPADISKLQNDPRMKNNIAAIPILNKNFLWVETDAAGLKGMEVTEIKNVNTTINTSGYQVKVMNSLKDMMKRDDNGK
jgi:hypothetical protein